MQKAMSFDDVALVSVKRNDCQVCFWYMGKDEAINVMKNYSFYKYEKKWVPTIQKIKENY